MLMLVTFLFELTAETPDLRASIYKTELTKVFFSVLYFYLLAMIFSNWLQSLKKFIYVVQKSQDRLKNAPKKPATELPRAKRE